MKKTRLLTLLLLSTIFLGFTLQTLTTLPIVHGSVGTIYSKYTENPPTLNGVISATEWEDANVYMDVGDEQRFDVYLMHDEDYFYIAVRANDATQSNSDNIALFFDEGDDGGFGSGSSDEVLTSGQENICVITLGGTIQDGYWKGPSHTHWYIYSAVDQIDFQAAMDYHINRLEAEFKIPFVGEEGKDDQSDLTIDRYDSLGFLINTWDYDNGFSGLYYYPDNPWFGDDIIQGDPTYWVTLAFDNEAPTMTNINVNPTQPEPDDSVTVTADVSDDVSGVLDVVLRYSISGGTSWSNVPMTSGSAYSGTIPQQADGTTVQYKIVARDNAGFTTESAVASYSVQAPAAPGPQIPGFPLEGILIGIMITALALTSIRKRQ